MSFQTQLRSEGQADLLFTSYKLAALATFWSLGRAKPQMVTGVFAISHVCPWVVFWLEERLSSFSWSFLQRSSTVFENVPGLLSAKAENGCVTVVIYGFLASKTVCVTSFEEIASWVSVRRSNGEMSVHLMCVHLICAHRISVEGNVYQSQSSCRCWKVLTYVFNSEFC